MTRDGRGSIAEKVRLLRWMLKFWIDVVRLQKKRCEGSREKLFEHTVDLIFYIDSLGRMRDIAHRTTNLHRIREISEREIRWKRLAKAKAALQTFDQKWPKLLAVRNQLEHLDAGLDTRFGKVVKADKLGHVETLISVADIHPDVEALYQGLKESLDDLALDDWLPP
ncbi:MAG TPA: hypothetical protein VHR45_12980 [Thermoanaerobaculia bacterium]|nr:hypothetical protein [Thermoanaerobaculia bacterium]